jgi:hypothetical protein
MAYLDNQQPLGQFSRRTPVGPITAYSNELRGVAPTAPTQPQIAPVSPNVGASPRTPDAAAGAYATELGAASPAASTVQPQIMALPNTGASPRTAAGPVAAYSAQLQGQPQVAPVASVAAPAAVAPATPSLVGPVLGAMARTALDPLASVRSDAADAYNAGAQTSVPTGVGMGARQALNSVLSRAGGAVLDASGAVRNAAMENVVKPAYEGVRAFITGRPPAPDTAAPVVGSAQAAPARAPVTIDGGTGQVITTGNTIPGTWHPADQDPTMRDFTVGGLRVQDTGVVDGQPATRSITGDRAFPTGVPSVRSGQGGVAVPQQVTAIPGSGGPTTPLGGLMRSVAGLQIARRANNDNQRTFNDQVKAANLDLTTQKVGGELKRSAAETGKTEAETTKLKQENENAVQVQALRSQLVNETDPKKRKVLENKLYALQGKKQGSYQVTQVESVDPATGMVTKTPYIIDSDTGNARPVAGAGAGPPGMTYLGKSPQGKRVFQDAQGNKHVED